MAGENVNLQPEGFSDEHTTLAMVSSNHLIAVLKLCTMPRINSIVLKIKMMGRSIGRGRSEPSRVVEMLHKIKMTVN